MQEKRKFKRVRLSDCEISGKMVLATEVRVVDISISGISLKANRRLNIGSDYSLKLEGEKTVSLRGAVIWCSLTETRKGPQGEMTPIYSAGMQFKDMSADRTADLQYLIESHKTGEVHVTGGTRLNIRFHIKDPEKAILIYPHDYTVKALSPGGMLIECQRNLEIESRIPMEMFVHEDKPIHFMGRVASSQVVEKEGKKLHHIGIEFFGLAEKDRAGLALLIDNNTATDTETDHKSKTPSGNSAEEDIPVISEKFIDMGIESLDLTEKDRIVLTSLMDHSAMTGPESEN